MTELIARNHVLIEATPARVWDVLTKAEHTQRYMFGCEPISDWRVGSSLEWTGVTDGRVYVKGIVEGLVASRRLQYSTFTPNAFDNYEDTPENYTTVTLGLTSTGSATELSVSQGDFSRIANGELRFAHTVNSWRSVLEKIKDIAERG